MKSAFSLAALMGLAPFAAAFWRLECHGVTGIAEIDPISDPGRDAAHAHTIKGSSGLFDNATVQDLLNAPCTSCQIKQDKSAYWEPQLFFMNKNGSVHVVNEIPGHLTYYKYTPVYNSKGVLMQPEALPNGLRVISGDKMRRNFSLPVPDPPLPWTGKDATQDALRQKAIGFNCLNYKKKPEDSLYRHFLPNKSYLENECPDGIRMEVLFPQCWNGKLDSADHQSHMAYADAGLNGGKCPPGYDRNTMQIFYETIYPTNRFKGVEGYYAFSNGDPTGYGYHGDLMIAWDEGVLQKALDLCGSDVTGASTRGVTSDCPIFKLVDPADQAKCLIPDKMQPKNLIKNPMLQKLPGNNPIQSGPEPATMGSDRSPKTESYKAPASTLVPTLSYSQGSANILKVNPTPAPAPAPAVPAVAAAPAAPAQNAPAPAPAANKPSTTLVQNLITPPPAPPAGAAGIVPVVSTTTYTKNGIVYVEAIVVDEVTVTDVNVVTVTQAAGGAAYRKREHRARHNHARFHEI